MLTTICICILSVQCVGLGFWIDRERKRIRRLEAQLSKVVGLLANANVSVEGKMLNETTFKVDDESFKTFLVLVRTLETHERGSFLKKSSIFKNLTLAQAEEVLTWVWPFERVALLDLLTNKP